MIILLVENDDRIADPLAEDLRPQSHAIDIAHIDHRHSVPLDFKTFFY